MLGHTKSLLNSGFKERELVAKPIDGRRFDVVVLSGIGDLLVDFDPEKLILQVV